MPQKKISTPLSTWSKKILIEGVFNTLFVFIYADHINWTLHEDAPWKDTIATETDQTLSQYNQEGIPVFISDLMNQSEIDMIKNRISALLK